MKYLKKFNTTTDYDQFKSGSDYVLPNVSFVVETNIVGFEQKKHVVFIQHVDGNLYTPAQWTGNSFSNDLANGVAVVTDVTSFVIAKDEFTKTKWYPTSSFVNNVSYISVSSATLTDYSNYETTARGILCGKADTDIIASSASQGAAVQCHNYIFSNGNRGYLPAIGELMVVSDYITEINDALTLINGTVFSNKYYFSSTQEKINTTTSPYNAFVVYPKSGSIYANSKTNVDWVNTRPFTTI